MMFEKHNYLRLFCVLLFGLVSFNCLAATIKLKTLQLHEKEDAYLVDADFALDLNDEVMDALLHGIPVQIHTDVQVHMIRDWYPDKTIKSVNLNHLLVHQPLTQDYLTINLRTGERQSFDNINSALSNLSSLSDVTLIKKNILSEEQQYRGRIRMYLDLDSLPTPMRPQVYFSSKWDISSDWHEWVIQE